MLCTKRKLLELDYYNSNKRRQSNHASAHIYKTIPNKKQGYIEYACNYGNKEKVN